MIFNGNIYAQVLAPGIDQINAHRLLSPSGDLFVVNDDCFAVAVVSMPENDPSMATLHQAVSAGVARELGKLAGNGLVHFSTGRENPVATLVPFAFGFSNDFQLPDFKLSYKVSRFTFICSEHNRLVIKNAQAFSEVHVHHPLVLAAFYKLNDGCTVSEFMAIFEAKDRLEALLLLLFFCNMKIALPCDSNGMTAEETNQTMQQWDFHDLLMHTQSRIGRTTSQLGGTFRFKGQIAPQPAIKLPRRNVLHAVALPRPNNLPALFVNDSLSSAIETRTSIRQHSVVPITLLQVSAFLYQVCRIKRCFVHNDVEYVSCPYPTGGASYEQGFYLTVHRCEGIAPGFYYYDPLMHSLECLSLPCFETEQILRDAATATGTNEPAQIVITIASRFQRVAWKYKGMAYSAQLKHVGVAFAYMYLVANAMGLAPCALGAGNTDLFCHLAGTDYYQEGSVGEFMLGTRPLL